MWPFCKVKSNWADQIPLSNKHIAACSAYLTGGDSDDDIDRHHDTFAGLTMTEIDRPTDSGC